MKVMFITNCDPAKSSGFEKKLKDLLLSQIPNLSLCFIHKGALPHEIADKAKDKKPAHIVLAKEFCSHQPQAVSEVITATKKRLKDRSPSFYQIDFTSSHPELMYVKNEEGLLELLKQKQAA